MGKKHRPFSMLDEVVAKAKAKQAQQQDAAERFAPIPPAPAPPPPLNSAPTGGEWVDDAGHPGRQVFYTYAEMKRMGMPIGLDTVGGERGKWRPIPGADNEVFVPKPRLDEEWLGRLSGGEGPEPKKRHALKSAANRARRKIAER